MFWSRASCRCVYLLVFLAATSALQLPRNTGTKGDSDSSESQIATGCAHANTTAAETMFDIPDEPPDLLDEDDDEAAAAAPPRAARHNGRAGMRNEAKSIPNFMLGYAKAKLKQRNAQLKRGKAANSTTFAKHVARVCFGTVAPEDAKMVATLGDESVNISQKNKGKRSDDWYKCSEYGTLSALKGQASGVARFVGREPSEVRSIISINTFDDAEMWVKDPASAMQRKLGTRVEGARVKSGKLWKRGKTIKLPVMNLVESIFARRNHSDGPSAHSVLRGCEVHSGSAVLCRANTSTIRQHWNDWSMIGTSGSGRRIDPEGSMSEALNASSAWITYVATKDNLALNQCIMGMEEDNINCKMQSNLEDETVVDTHLHLNCAGHSIVLSTQPCITRMDNFPGQCVRLGHLHESGKISQDHVNFLKEVVRKDFSFIPVSEMPEEFPDWERASRTILKVSRCGRDLAEKDEDLICAIDNGNWSSKVWAHYCLGARQCKAACDGDPKKAIDIMLTAAEISVGRAGPTPLTYRWKGMDVFLGIMYRGRRQHDAWLSTHQMMWPSNVVKRAAEAIERLAADETNSLDNNRIRFKTQIRGGMCVEMMEHDKEAHQVEHALVLFSAIQVYLNKCFAADKVVSQYTQHLQFISEGCVDEPNADISSLRQSCVDRNLEIISGDAGLEILELYTKYFTYDADVWEDWRLGPEGKYNCCLDLICVMQDTAYRVMFKMNIPKLQIFEICRVPEGEHFDSELVERAASCLRARRDACKDCVDQAFTHVWCVRLLDMGEAARRQAHRNLSDVLALLRVTSVKVERKHLIGQELRVKKRGTGTTCAQLGQQVFRQSVQRGSELYRQEAKTRCLGEDAKVVATFMKSLEACNTSGHSDRRTTPANETQRPSAASGNCGAKRKKRGYDLFVSQNYDATEETEDGHVFSKRKLVDEKWAILSAEQRNVYNACAEQWNETAVTYDDEDYQDFFNRTGGVNLGKATRKRRQYKSERLRAVQNTVTKMVNDQCLDAGTRIHEFDAGVKSSLVCCNLSRKDVQDQLGRVFAYDHVPKENPQGRMTFFEPCCLRHGGFCGAEDFVESLDTLVHNLHVSSRDWKESFPVLLQFGLGPLHEWAFLGRLIGDGKLSFLTPMVLETDIDGLPHAAELSFESLPGRGQMSMPQTSQTFFHRALLKWQHAHDADFQELDALVMNRWNFKQDPFTNVFRVILNGEHSTCILSCKEKLALRSKPTQVQTGMFSLAKGNSSLMKPSKKKLDKLEKKIDEASSNLDADSDSKSGRSWSSVSDAGGDKSDHEDGDKKDDAAAATPAPAAASEEVSPAAAAAAAPEPKPEPEAEPWNCVGIKAWDVAPSSRSKCFICDESIKKDKFRLDFRVKVSIYGTRSVCILVAQIRCPTPHVFAIEH